MLPLPTHVVNVHAVGYRGAMKPTVDAPPYHHGNLRSTLLVAAERALRKHGTDQLSLRDLAREIGVSHAAPRRHFKDRQALLDALAAKGFQRLDASLRTALARAGDDFAAQMRATMTAYVRFATTNATLLDLMYASKHRPGATQLVEAASAPFGRMIGLIAEGQARGDLKAGDPERIGLVMFATLQGIASLINGRMIKRELLDGLTETAVQQFLAGARPLAWSTLDHTNPDNHPSHNARAGRRDR